MSSPGVRLILEQIAHVGDNAPPAIKHLLTGFRLAISRYYGEHGRPPGWDELAREVMKPVIDELRAEVDRLTRMLTPK
jgi:hypothetical protein